MATNPRLRILLLAETLPNPRDPDCLFHIKNSFVRDPMVRIAGSHQVDYPLFVPHAPGLIKKFYRLRGSEVHFPAPRQGEIDRINFETLHYLFLPRFYPAMKTRALLRHIEHSGEQYDLVHCHTIYDLGLVGLKMKEKLGVPLVATVYGTDVNWLFEEAENRAAPGIVRATIRALTCADAVICVSRDLDHKVRQLGVAEKRITWIPNGIESRLFYPGDQATERERLGWEGDEKIVLFVGNLYLSKGLGDLVEAVGLIEEKAGDAPQFKVMIAGRPGGDEPEIRRMIAERSLEEKFDFLGLQTPRAIASMMRACDLFCLPSWREGWPCVVLEALASGRPVVATTEGGIPEMVTDSDLGILCPRQSPAELASALTTALTRKWDQARIAEAAEPYIYDRLAKQIEEVYCKVLNR